MNFTWILKLLIAPVIGVLIMMTPMFFFVRAITSPEIVTAEAPGTAPFAVEEEGMYTIWRLSAGVMNGSQFRVESEDLPAGLTMHIRRASDGTTVTLKESMGATQSRTGSPTKYSLAKAELSPGEYELVSGTDGEQITLIISKSVGSAGGFFVGIALFFLGLLVLAGGVVYAVFAILRKATANKATSQVAPPPQG